MCINFESSVFSFLLGTTTGLILSMQESVYKKSIGIFIFFFSFVQLFEAFIYKGYDSNGLFSKLIFANLSLQGLVLCMALFFICKLQDIKWYLLFNSIIAGLLLFHLFSTNFQKNTSNNCTSWIFMDLYTRVLLFAMYISIIYYLLTNKNLFLYNFGLFLSSTAIISYFISYITVNAPSMWCLTSALFAPFLLVK